MVSRTYLEYTEKALDNIDKTVNYIKNVLQNKQAAKKLLESIKRKVNISAEYPESCQLIPTNIKELANIRKAVINSYSLFYEYDKGNGRIIILNFVYNHQDLNGMLQSLTNSI